MASSLTLSSISLKKFEKLQPFRNNPNIFPLPKRHFSLYQKQKWAVLSSDPGNKSNSIEETENSEAQDTVPKNSQ